MRTQNDQKGATLIEFIAVLPIMLILLFASIEFGVMGYNKALITNAAREGARAGIVFDASQSSGRISSEKIEEITRNYFENYVISFSGGADINVELDPEDCEPETDCESGDELKVTVTYDYGLLVLPNLFKILGLDFNSTFALNGVSIMRRE